MKRIYQTKIGPKGNCMSACLAMVMGYELDQVPNFAEAYTTGGEQYKAVDAWLRGCGMWALCIVKWQSLPWPPPQGIYIAGGYSPRGISHAVVFQNGVLWHDPHPDGGGIKEVEDATFIMPIVIEE